MNETQLRERSVFLQAIEISSIEERDAFLAEACGPNERLRTEIDALLLAHDRPLGLLDVPDSPSPISEHPGSIIGPYKLLEQIGEGGMGIVFMAEQTQPIQRKVALKIIKPGMDTQQVIARFEAERQALALMDHPNIARVLDAGTTESGRPYFVMELVHGIPTTDYCDRHQLSVRKRLELFVTICQAVQHAHQKGVIHRDLKPTNVLVAQHDGRPLAKVIDFGVAKATGQKLTEKTLFTGFAQLIGTPLYMAPEQAELNAPDVDTRSDIYSLGVLLYELLTGSTPFDSQRLKDAAFDELRRIMREEEPPRPSTRLSTLAQQAISTISEKRNSDPRHLSRLFQGELDWIAMKALEKDRTRRYETASALADDVERYLHDEPVQACPPSRIYRLRKFASRYRAGIAIAGAFVGLFAIGTAVSVWQAIRATHAEQQAKASEQFALKNSRRADAISDFLINAFRSPDPARDGRTVTMAELLDRAVNDVKEEFADDQRMQADLLNSLAQSYQGLGLYRESVLLFAKVQELRSAALGPLDLSTIESLSDLASACEIAGQLDKAISLHEEILKIQQAHLAPDDPDVLSTTTKLAWNYNQSGQSEKALALFESVLRMAKAKVKNDGAVPGMTTDHDDGSETDDGPKKAVRLLSENTFEPLDDRGPKRKDVLVALNNLGLAFAQAGQVNQAIPLYQQTLKLMQDKLGPDDPTTLVAMYNLAMSFKVAGRYDEAIPLFDETLRLRRLKLGPEDPVTVATMTCTGATYGAAGKHDQYTALYGEVLRIRQAKLGDEHPETIWAMWQYGICLYEVNRENDAVALWEKALALSKVNPGIDHPTTLGLINTLASVYRANGRIYEAISLIEEVFKLRKANLGPDNPATLSAMQYLARAYEIAGQLDKALGVRKERLNNIRNSLGTGNVSANTALIRAMRDLGETYEAMGQLDDAEALLKEALRVAIANHNPERLAGDATNNLGFLRILQGQYAEAEALLREDLLQLRAAYPNESMRLHHLALALLMQGQFVEAETLARECMEIRAKLNPGASGQFAAQSLLGGALMGQKKYTEAEPLLVSAYEEMQKREADVGAARKVLLRYALERVVHLYELTNQPEKVAQWKVKLAELDKASSTKSTAATNN